MKRGGKLRRRPKVMPAAEKEHADRFREVVLAKRPILIMQERQSGIVDCHHVIPKQLLADRFRDLEDEERWQIVWSPDVGVPIDRFRHEQVTNAFKRLFPAELRPENFAFAERHDLMHLLKREVPLLRSVEHGY